MLSTMKSNFIRVSSTKPYPFRVTCRVIVDEGLNSGSGFLVGPNIMLTAAHVLYDKDNDNRIRSIRVYPGYNEGAYSDESGRPYSCGWNAIYRSSIWLETHDPEYDWALVELDSYLGNSLGWYGTKTYGSDSALKGVKVNEYGYPYEYGESRVQYYTTGDINKVSERYFETDAANRQGMSGGPIAQVLDDYAVGIIQGTIRSTFRDDTYGVRINSYLMNLIKDYQNK